MNELNATSEVFLTREFSENITDGLLRNGSEGGSNWTYPFGPSYPPLYLVILSVASVIGNSVILHAVCASQTFCRPVNFMLGNLAFTSIIRVIMANVLFVEGGAIQQFSQFTCHLYPTLIRTYNSAEGFTVIFLSVSRTRIIRNPWDRETSSRAIKKIAATWIIGFLIELPRSLFLDFDSSKDLVEGIKRCVKSQELLGSIWPWMVYVILHFIVSSLLPSALLIRELITLILEFRCVVSTCTVGEKKDSSRKVLQGRLMRNGIIFTSVFILIKLPTGGWLFLWSFPWNLLNESIITFLHFSVYPIFVIMYLNAAFFPLLIFGLSHELRNYCYKFSRGRLFTS